MRYSLSREIHIAGTVIIELTWDLYIRYDRRADFLITKGAS
jgi:hypothetical protein